MPSFKRVVLSSAACLAMAFALCFLFGDRSIGLGQPGLLTLAIPAAILGVTVRRAILGALIAPLLGVAGAAGLLLRISPNDPNWLLCVLVLGSLGGIGCVIVATVAGYAGERWAIPSRTNAPKDQP